MDDATQVISRVEEFDSDPQDGCWESLKMVAVAVMGFGVGVATTFAVVAIMMVG